MLNRLDRMPDMSVAHRNAAHLRIDAASPGRSRREPLADPIAVRWLVAAVAGFACLGLLIGGISRFWAYDEAIYLSQVYPGTPLPFTAPRARGLPWLLWPMGALDAPVPLVRSYLLVVNAGLMYLGFRAWLPILRRRTALAAALSGLAGVSMFEATEVFPNLPVALLAVGAAGYLARTALARPRARAGALAKAAAALCLMGLIRPMEATFVAAGLLAAAVLLPARLGLPTSDGRAQLVAAGRRWAVLITGLAIAWVPWLIEAQVRFGGPIQRLRAATGNVSGGWHPANIARQLALTDGPLSARATGAPGPLPEAGMLWWAALGAGVMVTLAAALRMLAGPHRAGPRSATATAGAGAVCGSVAALAGAASAAEYLLFAGVVEARFLIPAYALLSVSLAAAIPDAGLGRPRSIQIPVLVGAAVLLSAFGGWQAGVAAAISHQQTQVRAVARNLADVLDRESQGQPCFFASQSAFPEIAFGSGCHGTRFHRDWATVQLDADPGSAPVYLLSAGDPRDDPIQPVPGSARSLQTEGAGGWWLSVAPPSRLRITVRP